MGRVTVHPVHSFSPGIIIESISGDGKLYDHLIICYQKWLGDGAL